MLQCTNDRLPQKSMCSGSRDLFRFCEISDNISQTVQDRDMVATKVQYEVVCGLSKGIIANALE